MKLLVVGSRGFDDYPLLKKTLDGILEGASDIEIVSGGANGADKLAERYARERGYAVHVIKPKWNSYGKMAGYLRNSDLHRYTAQDPNRHCVVFWDGFSRGSQHSFKLAEQYDTPLTVVKYRELEQHRNTDEGDIQL